MQLLLSGAREGLSTLLSIAPSLIVLLTGISMLRSSGFFAWMGAGACARLPLSRHAAGAGAA